MKTDSKTFKAISLFTGAGGLDIGFEQAGFEILSAVEINPRFCDTILANQSKKIAIPGFTRHYFEGTKVINDDISSLNASDLNPYNLDIDCLIGGPPCQAFSSAGKQESIFDHRGTLIYEFLRLLKEIKPKVFLFENVRGLATARGMNGVPGEVLMCLVDLMKKEGYNCRVSLLNSADYGSYQRRVRCFIIGSRIGSAPEFPTATHSNLQSQPGLFHDGMKPWKTLGEFLLQYSDKDENNWVRPSDRLKETLSTLHEGSGLKSMGRKEATRPSGHWGYRQGAFIADTTKPARTVTGSSSQDWIKMKDGSHRRLTLKEVAALQGFPPEWEFRGSKANQFQQVGNAVPTIFGKTIGKTLHEYLKQTGNSTTSTIDVNISPKILESIRYTKYDFEKNGSYRVNRINGFTQHS